jgi:hypothetical protein
MSTEATPPPSSALSAASQTIREGLARFDQAAAAVARAANPPQGAPDPGELLTDIIELSHSARQVRLGVAIARTDQAVGYELVNMVRHDASASSARDTRPRPQRGRARHGVDIVL